MDLPHLRRIFWEPPPCAGAFISLQNVLYTSSPAAPCPTVAAVAMVTIVAVKAVVVVVAVVIAVAVKAVVIVVAVPVLGWPIEHVGVTVESLTGRAIEVVPLIEPLGAAIAVPLLRWLPDRARVAVQSPLLSYRVAAP